MDKSGMWVNYTDGDAFKHYIQYNIIEEGLNFEVVVKRVFQDAFHRQVILTHISLQNKFSPRGCNKPVFGSLAAV